MHSDTRVKIQKFLDEVDLGSIGEMHDLLTSAKKEQDYTAELAGEAGPDDEAQAEDDAAIELESAVSMVDDAYNAIEAAISTLENLL